MKIRYEKREDAPEGDLRLLLANDEYVLDKDHAAIESEDAVVQADLDAHPFLKRAGAARSEANAEAREARKRQNAVEKAQAKADKFNAEKKPEEPAKTAEDFLEKQEGAE